MVSADELEEVVDFLSDNLIMSKLKPLMVNKIFTHIIAVE